MGLRIRKTKRLALLIFTSLLLLVVLFRLFQGYSLFEHFVTPREVNDSEKAHCLSKLLQSEGNRGADWSNEFYEPAVWKSFVSYMNGGRKDARKVSQSLSSLRWYQQCTKETTIDQDVHLLREVESKLFPYMNFAKLSNEDSQAFWPLHTRFDGTTHRGRVLHFSVENNSFIGTSPVGFISGRSFWENWLHSAIQKDSKGLVMSASDALVSDTIRLMRILRLLNNSLPIEIVHKSDLSKSSQQLLIASARESASSNYPPQELWFLDVKSLIKDEYLNRFKRFSNKWLAITFSSFQMPIFLDSDTVPFVPLDGFYRTGEFERTGTLFFKDRSFPLSKLSSQQTKALRQIINNSLGISSNSEQGFESLKNSSKDDTAIGAIDSVIFKQQKHYMDSGLLVIDKQKHFFCLPIAIMLQFSPIQEYFHGDKEWFWLSLLLSNEEFTFHPVEASNVGKLEESSTPESGQICSIQLAHTDVHGNLLWLNGGLSVCKKACWKYDFTKRKGIAAKYKSVNALQKYYQSPVILENVITPEVSKSSWLNRDECAMYTYCTNYKRGEYGTLIKFTDSQKRYYEKFVQLWNEVV
ncbi:putative alpha-1,3-mannosyltransferase SKDI_14G3820 [Saccharomyces kudriavzevii IFO 1802]|uniref:MNT4-like protein n=2 Tax=Saccharomyces kudriavzevii (strain ATCC MYA-4449 / AS 2.2408 / CBS 8840 / NBRC 1802 / NCYC 2889) TaxID=226230 RepID=J5P5N0_SACK1|nr:uncharacterized protein SKDI_14G3820 [Saccharomyces kudriavzevii IFO 1802]EJT41318.1 MNT4-like protein [Saccharomyces kudriavzevii IFO 1802]CAI4050583.1 hypothetical protein SKDI_14G3820 [Saccharomyces kudriavzevii IFO 1802]